MMLSVTIKRQEYRCVAAHLPNNAGYSHLEFFTAVYGLADLIAKTPEVTLLYVGVDAHTRSSQ